MDIFLKNLINNCVRILAKTIAKLLSKTSITATQITIINFLIFLPLATYLFLQGKYLYNLMGFLAILTYTLLDHVDGELARLKQTSSKVGGWLDARLDQAFLYVLIFITSYSGLQETGNLSWVIIYFFMMFGFAMAHYMIFEYDHYIGIEKIFHFKDKFTDYKDLSLSEKFFINLLDPKSTLIIFLFSFSYWFFLGIILNRLFIFYIIISVLYNFRWLVLFVYFIKFLSLLDRGNSFKENSIILRKLYELRYPDIR